MKKVALLLLQTFLTSSMFAQNYTETESYAVDEYIEKCTDIPVVRQINGGTVFNVTYEPEALWDNSMKGAFEYACKIWEEQLPNSLPINIHVKLANIRGNNNSQNLLSKVSSTTYDYSYNESVLSSRIKYVLLAEYNSGHNVTYVDNVNNVDFFSKPDITITYNKNMLNEFSFSLDNTPVAKYDFVTVALRDIARGLGFSFNLTANSNTQTFDNTNRSLTYYENIVRQAIGGNNSSEAYTNATQGALNLSVNYYKNTLSLYAPSVWINGISLNYLIPEESKNFTELLSYNFGKGSVSRNIVDNYNSIFYDFQGWQKYNLLVGYNPVSESSTGSTNNLIAYNGSISLNTNSNNTNISSNEDSSPRQSVSRKINLTMDTGDFDLSSYLFPYNYMYPDNSGFGAWLISLLKKDGTWELVYRQSIDSFNFPLQTSMSEWNISSNHEQYARTCDGYLRCRITRYKKLNDQLYQRPYYDIDNYYYVLDYLPQQVKMSYSQENQVSPTRIMSSSSDEYTQDIKIFIKDIEGTNRVIVEQLDEGNDLPIKYEVTDFKKGYFVATVDKELFTEFVVYSYNNNGSTVSETLVVDPLVPYDFSIHLSGDKIIVNGNTRNDSRLFNYNIYSSSTTTLQHVKKGVVSTTNPVIQTSDLSKGAYILDIKSGKKQKSVRFVK